MRLLRVVVFLTGCYFSFGGDDRLCSQSMHAIAAVLPSKAVGQGSAETSVLQEHLGLAKASGVLVDWNTGRVLATVGEEHTASPGSILKPLLLSYAMQHGIVDAKTRVYCRRNLRVGGRSLACFHPDAQPLLDAQEALAFSCNTWFAALARRMTAQDIEAVLRQAGFTLNGSHLEDADTRVLTALGIENVSTTPMQIAVAYRALLLHEAHDGVVWNGLRDSVAYGMANNARVNDVEVIGKTGTASNRDEWWSHGWFVGGEPGRVVLVVYLPHGDGGEAATLAGDVLRALPRGSVR